MVPRAVLDAVVKRKIPSSRRESNHRTPIFQSITLFPQLLVLNRLRLKRFPVLICLPLGVMFVQKTAEKSYLSPNSYGNAGCWTRDQILYITVSVHTTCSVFESWARHWISWLGFFAFSLSSGKYWQTYKKLIIGHDCFLPFVMRVLSKGKIFPVLNEIPRYKYVLERGGIAPCILNLGTRSRWVCQFHVQAASPPREELSVPTG
jgi:hypothetical protein